MDGAKERLHSLENVEKDLMSVIDNPGYWNASSAAKPKHTSKSVLFGTFFGDAHRNTLHHDSLRGNKALSDYNGKGITGEDSNTSGRQSANNLTSVGKHSSSSTNTGEEISDDAQIVKKNHKISTIKQLFSTSKFQKHCKRGIFLACIMYSEGKLLVTNEDYLPTVEVDDTFPCSLHSDFYWLLKISTTWESVKSFKADMEKSGNATMFHFRLKLLDAIISMQSALGITDLGRLYYRPTSSTDHENAAVIISTINYLRSPKVISCMSVRWISLSKVSSRNHKASDGSNLSDVILSSIEDQILYHQVSNIPMGRGLYLGFLTLTTAVDVLKVAVSKKTPNMIPHVKLRDDPKITKDEWNALIQMCSDKLDLSNNNAIKRSSATGADLFMAPRKTHNNIPEFNRYGSENLEEHVTHNNKRLPGQKMSSSKEKFDSQDLQFKKQLFTGMKRLISLLELDKETVNHLRFYHPEVVRISNFVSLLLVVPAWEKVCLPPGESNTLLRKKDIILVPLQVFETINMSTYHQEFFSRFARISAIHEMNTSLAKHNLREAFSSDEVAAAKARVDSLQELQLKLDTLWKGSRWIASVIQNSRDKGFSLAPLNTLLKNLEVDVSLFSDRSRTINNEIVRKRGVMNDEKSEVAACGKLGGSTSLSSVQTNSAVGRRGSGSANSTPSKISHKEVGCGPIYYAGSLNGSFNESKVSSNPPLLFSSSMHHVSHSQSDIPDFLFGDVASISKWKAEILSSSSLQYLNSVRGNLRGLDSSSSEQLSDNNNVYTQPAMAGTEKDTQLNSIFSQCYSRNSSNNVQNNAVSSNHDFVQSNAHLPPHNFAIQKQQQASCDSFTASSSSRLSARVESVDVGLNNDNYNNHNLGNFTRNSLNLSSRSNSMSYEGELTSPIAGRYLSNPLSPTESLLQSSTDLLTAAVFTSPMVIQVYAAYHCGLAEGTSVRMQINSQTTARQVVDLIVAQLNTQAKAKGIDNPIVQTQEFVLVSVVGARERCLRNDFKPLFLQNPWRSGRLYVRRRNDVTSAIEMNSRERDWD